MSLRVTLEPAEALAQIPKLGYGSFQAFYALLRLSPLTLYGWAGYTLKTLSGPIIKGKLGILIDAMASWQVVGCFLNFQPDELLS